MVVLIIETSRREWSTASAENLDLVSFDDILDSQVREMSTES